ncbi:hypothetical protein [Nocardiopsis chromatogenes]|uniref:hypothetical protein n=1 Tax=Nocardiopsis chromatogenes TaxID=280239 RepID=UPI00037B4D44|nr:hypothetical protein [Nocardiopsis chromatogenes]
MSAFDISAPWALTVVPAIGVAAALGAGVLQTRHEQSNARRQEQLTARQEGCLTLANGRLPRVRDLPEPLAWKVHPATHTGVSMHEGTLSPVPPYIPRDIDQRLRQAISAGSFVLVIGESTAGKTRCAQEAVAATLPSHTLIAPTRSGLPAALQAAKEHRKCVLWLNDLETYLPAPELTPEALAGLTTPASRSHRVVVATVRTNEFNRLYARPADPAERAAADRARNVLALAHQERLPRRFTASEVERAAKLSWDPRIARALEHANTFGLAEYMAHGPQLLAMWENAWSPNTDPTAPSHPRGAAFVAAAVALRTAGYLAQIPRALIEDVHGFWLEERGGNRLAPESVEEAWTWATAPQEATTRLLYQVGDDVSAFDYLIDAEQTRSAFVSRAPEGVIRQALSYADSPSCVSMADMAESEENYDLALTAARKAYEKTVRARGDGHPETLRIRQSLAHYTAMTGDGMSALIQYSNLIKDSERFLGADHSITLTSREGVALTTGMLGGFSAARDIYSDLVTDCVRLLSHNHHLTIAIREGFAISNGIAGDIEVARSQLNELLKDSERILGPQHPTTIDVKYTLKYWNEFPEFE